MGTPYVESGYVESGYTEGDAEPYVKSGYVEGGYVEGGSTAPSVTTITNTLSLTYKVLIPIQLHQDFTYKVLSAQEQLHQDLSYIIKDKFIDTHQDLSYIIKDMVFCNTKQALFYKLGKGTFITRIARKNFAD